MTGIQNTHNDFESYLTSYKQFCTYELTLPVEYTVLNFFLSTKLFVRILVKMPTVQYIIN